MVISMLQRKRRELQSGSFSSGNLIRCLSDVPCAAVVVVRHKRLAGRLVFNTATVLNSMLFLFVFNKEVLLI